MQFFTTYQLGPKRGFTPEGFLICYDAPLSRTGIQVYSASEVYPGGCPPGVGPSDPIRVSRTEAEVFAEEAVASAQGKILVDEHPEEDGERVDVTPDNWRRLGAGHIMNPHRGVGAQDDLLLGDLVVTDRRVINLIMAGKRELSCGYDAAYVPIAPGHLEQHTIRINHVALVDSGRCGARCAIGDDSPEGSMKRSIIDRITSAFKARDEAGFTAAVRDAETTDDDEGEHHVHVHVGGGPGAKEEAEMHDNEAGLKGLTDAINQLNSNHGEMKNLMTDVRDALRDDRGRHHRDDDKRKKHHDAIDAMDCSDDDKRRLHDALDDDKHRDDDDDKHRDDDDDKHRDDDDDKHRDAGEVSGLPSPHQAPHNWGLETPPGAARRGDKMRDSALFSDSFRETLAIAEILAPGVRLPTFDSAAKPGKTYDAMCSLRRRALTAAWADLNTREIIEPVVRDDTIAEMSGDQLRSAFLAAGALKREANNRLGVRDSAPTALKQVGGVASIADYNKRKDELWAKANGSR